MNNNNMSAEYHFMTCITYLIVQKSEINQKDIYTNITTILAPTKNGGMHDK